MPRDLVPLFRGNGVCSGADDCARAVRERVRDGADIIKITATGGVLSNTAAGLGQQFTDAELAAIVQAAHSMGRKVTAHAHGADGINSFLKAGGDSIEHGTYANDESAALFKANGAYSPHPACG
jgi:imidazolonepropionase-like amidohydrolase